MPFVVLLECAGEDSVPLGLEARCFERVELVIRQGMVEESCHHPLHVPQDSLWICGGLPCIRPRSRSRLGPTGSALAPKCPRRDCRTAEWALRRLLGSVVALCGLSPLGNACEDLVFGPAGVAMEVLHR